MPKFKVGDVITGTGKGSYSITTDKAIMAVLSVGGDEIKVEIIAHQKPGYIGDKFDVSPRYFKVVKDFTNPRIKILQKEAEMFKKKLANATHPSRFYPRGDWTSGLAEVRECIDDPNGTADFVILNADGTYQGCIGSACHAPLSYNNGDIPMYVVSAVRTKPEHGKKLMDWLIHRSPHSPYIINKTVADVFKRGLIIRTDLPSNMMAQALVITRQLWEYPNIVSTWRTLVDAGIHESVAYGFAHLVDESDGNFRYCRQGGGHNAMNGAFMNAEFFKNFLGGTPKNPNANYIENSSYRGIHNLWSSDGRGGVYGDGVTKQVIKSNSLKGHVDVKVKTWGKHYETQQRVPKEVALKQLKQIYADLMKEIGYEE